MIDYATVPAAERDRTLDREDDLAAAVVAGRRAGWLAYEAEPLIGAAQRLGVVLWRELVDGLQREACEAVCMRRQGSACGC